MSKKKLLINTGVTHNRTLFHNLNIFFKFCSTKQIILVEDEIKIKIKKVLYNIYNDYNRSNINDFVEKEDLKKDIIREKIIKLYSIVFPDLFSSTTNNNENINDVKESEDSVFEKTLDEDSDDSPEYNSDDYKKTNKQINSINEVPSDTIREDKPEKNSFLTVKEYIDLRDDQKLSKEDLKELDEILEKLGITRKKCGEFDEELDEDGLTAFEREFGVGDFYSFFDLTIDTFEPIIIHPLITHIKINFYLINHTLLKTLDDVINLIHVLNNKYAEMPIYAIRVYEFPAEDASLIFTEVDSVVNKILTDQYWKDALHTISYDPNRSQFTDVYSVAYKDKRYSYDTDNFNDVSMSPQFETMLMHIWPHNRKLNNWAENWPLIYIVHFYTPDIFSKAPIDFEGPFDPY